MGTSSTNKQLKYVREYAISQYVSAMQVVFDLITVIEPTIIVVS